MKQFFKFVTASCLGTILAFFGLFIIFAIVGGIMGATQSATVSDGILLLEFADPIPEKTGNIPQQKFSLESQTDLGLYHIKRLIENAQTDPTIKGIVYKASPSTPLGTVTASAIRESLKEFRDSTDKFIYTYADFFDNTSYLLASSSDSIYVNPNGIVDVNGYSAMIPFFKGAMEKIGVEMNVFYAGQFKSATESFRRKDMSEQNRRQTQEYLNDNYELYLDEVTHERNISVDKIKEIINEFDLDNAQKSLDNNLVDGLLYWFEFEDMLRGKLDIKKGKKINFTTLESYANNTSLTSGTSKNRIAVIHAEGEVVFGKDERGSINESTYHEIFDKIRKDKKVKAVVLRVNSPGGSAYTSDVIWREMKALQADGIPVIASFGDYAASGGYYIAASADTIVAHPKTLTGSIGVFSMMPNFTELMNDKLGITFDTVKTSPHAIVLSPFYEIGDEEKVAMQGFTDNMYNKFLDRVAEGRGKTRAEINEVAQGRVWTGQKAQQIGLVDVLGDLQDAVTIAAEKSGIKDDYKVVEYPRIEKDFWEQIMQEVSKSTEAKLSTYVPKDVLKIEKTISEMKRMAQYKEPMARMPFILKN